MMANPEEGIDYGEDLNIGPTDNILAKISHLAELQLVAEVDVEKKQAELKAAQERLRDLSERQLPEAMAEARQTSLKTDSGATVELKDVVRASLAEGRKPKAIQWMRDNNRQALIRTTIEIPFEAGRDIAALGLRLLLGYIARNSDVMQALHQQLKYHVVNNEEIAPLDAAFAFLMAIGNAPEERILLDASVWPATVTALVRELLRDGKLNEELKELFGAHAYKQAIVSLPD